MLEPQEREGLKCTTRSSIINRHKKVQFAVFMLAVAQQRFTCSDYTLCQMLWLKENLTASFLSAKFSFLQGHVTDSANFELSFSMWRSYDEGRFWLAGQWVAHHFSHHVLCWAAIRYEVRVCYLNCFLRYANLHLSFRLLFFIEENTLASFEGILNILSPLHFLY